jgi:hypothetical protein
MAICRADGSSTEEARLVADHLVLARSWFERMSARA